MTTNSHDPSARKKALIIVIAVCAAGLIAGGVFALNGPRATPPSAEPTATSPSPSSTAPTDPDSTEDENIVNTPSPVSPQVLPTAMSGQEAIDALGDKIESVANRNNMSVDELKDLLLRDTTAHISTSGHIFYRDDFGGAKP